MTLPFDEIPDANDHRNYDPIFVEIPEDAFEVHTSDGRVFYNLGVLVRDLGRNFAANGIQIAMFGTEIDCARSLGHMDAVNILQILHDGLVTRGLTHGG